MFCDGRTTVWHLKQQHPVNSVPGCLGLSNMLTRSSLLLLHNNRLCDWDAEMLFVLCWHWTLICNCLFHFSLHPPHSCGGLLAPGVAVPQGLVGQKWCLMHYLTAQCQAMYTVSQKKRPSLSFAVTLTNTDRFSKFFHWYIVWKICNNAVIKYPTTS